MQYLIWLRSAICSQAQVTSSTPLWWQTTSSRRTTRVSRKLRSIFLVTFPKWLRKLLNLQIKAKPTSCKSKTIKDKKLQPSNARAHSRTLFCTSSALASLMTSRQRSSNSLRLSTCLFPSISFNSGIRILEMETSMSQSLSKSVSSYSKKVIESFLASFSTLT